MCACVSERETKQAAVEGKSFSIYHSELLEASAISMY